LEEKELNQNKWKRLFFLLLGFNVAMILLISISLFILLNKPIEEKEREEELLYENRDGISFQIETNKRDLNRMINHYIEENFGNIDYHISLKDRVELYGILSIFGLTVDLKMTFEPVVLNNGDLELHQKDMYVGKLQVSPSLVLKLIKSSYQFPNWVMIEPNKEKVYLSIRHLELKSDMKVRIKQFDLREDRIKISLQVPI